MHITSRFALGASLVITVLVGCSGDQIADAPLESAKPQIRHDVGSATSQPICANAANTTGAFDVGTNGAWRQLVSFPGAGWIGPQANSDLPTVLVPVGEYTYVTGFSSTNGQSLSGQILADNGATVYLNDVEIATLGAVDTFVIPSYDTMQIPTSFMVNSGLLQGSNALKVVVYNAAPAGPSGTSYCFTVVEATNVNPVATVGGPYVSAEGSPTLLALSATDANAADILGYEWDFGDGSTGAGAVAPASHTYLDNGVYTITLKANDGRGGSDTESTTVTVANVEPELGTISASSSLVPIGTRISMSVPVSDAGSLDTHIAIINWQDLSSSTVNALAGAISGDHTYTIAGVYEITISVNDDDGGVSNTASHQYVVVYDPAAGFVTGAGWILSPAGAYENDPRLSGKAMFGFVSKYHKGASVPTGTTEFQFQAAGLSFKSTSYQWMVIAGAKAQFKGEGALNGVSGYSFIVFATDGQRSGAGEPDSFRIRITGPGDGLVYDNQRGEPEADGAIASLGGGNIIIHNK